MSKDIESRSEDSRRLKEPLVIYIAETDHGDMSYSSLLRKVIEDCNSKGLKTKVFSEFGNEQLKSQDEKLMTQASNLSNVPEKEIHESTTKILNERSIPMGNLYERFTQHIPNAWESLPDNIRPSTLFEARKSQIDNPETLELLEAEIRIRQANQENKAGKIGDRDWGEKNDDSDVANVWGNGNAFVQQMTHQAMAEDVARKRNGDEDVIIMIAGSPHIYGIDKELGSEFQDCQKLVVGNFREFELDLSSLESIRQAQHLSGKASCQEVGEVVGFEVGLDKQATIPSIISEALERKMALHTARGVAENFTQNAIDEGVKSFVDKHAPRSRRSGSFVDMIAGESDRGGGRE